MVQAHLVIPEDQDKSIQQIQEMKNQKLDSLLSICEEYMESEPSRSLRNANEALELSKTSNNIEAEIDALHAISASFKNMGKLDTAFIYVQYAVKKSDSINDIKRLADNTVLQGNILFRYDSPEAAKPNYYKGLSLYKKLNDSIGIADCYNGIGTVFMRQVKYDSAIYYYHELIKLSGNIHYLKGLGKAYINIGIAYSDLKEFDKSQAFLKKSIPINEKLGNLRYLGVTYNMLGNNFYDFADYDQSLENYMQALKIYEKLGNIFGIANASNNIGNIYEENGDYKIALDYYKKAKSLYLVVGDRDGFIASFKNTGLIYERQKAYHKALEIYDSCLLIAKEINSLYRQREIYYNIYRTYELTGNYDSAFKYILIHDEIKDSIFNIEKSKAISELEIKFEKEQDQARILSLEKETLEKDLRLRKRTNQRNGYLYTGISIVILVVFFTLYFRQKVRKDRIIAEQKIRQLEEEKKLLAVKSLVEGQEVERKRVAKELHDGLGVLLSTAKIQFSSIQSDIPENKDLIDKATALLDQAAGDVRQISHNMMPGLLTRFGLYEAVADLLEKVDETEEINVEANLPVDAKRLPETMEIMLYRIIQEMVNNTLKHAKAKRILCRVNVLDGKVNIVYSDDGIGFNVEEKSADKTIGLQSIRSRVNFLGGTFQAISSPEKGTEYTIEVPV